MSLIEQMSKELRIDIDYINNVARNNHKYKRYMISSGRKKREIFHPSKELKTLQYWVVNRIFNKLPISEFVAAYEKGCSIKANAKKHQFSKYILHTDIENYFNSITTEHIINLLKIHGYEGSDIQFICKVVLYEEHLVIGSVSAPRISNCVMFDFDLELYKEISKIQNVTYSRYADDIVIS